MIHPWKVKGMGSEDDTHILLLGRNNRERDAIFHMKNSKEEETFIVSLPKGSYIKCTQNFKGLDALRSSPDREKWDRHPGR